jgi:hypothetical protein
MEDDARVELRQRGAGEDVNFVAHFYQLVGEVVEVDPLPAGVHVALVHQHGDAQGTVV